MKTIIIYNSKSSFTEKYTNVIAKSLNCKSINIKKLKKENLKEYTTLIFGSRIIAGKIEKLNKIKKIIKTNNIKNLIIFTTGSTPNKATNVLNQMWSNNLTKEELNHIPHFHMQSGMNIEKLPIIEKMMLKMAKKIVSNKKNKTQEDIEFEKAISNSFDISNNKYTEELIKFVKQLSNK